LLEELRLQYALSQVLERKVDVLVIMEKLGIIEDQQEWINIRLLRNVLLSLA